MTDAPATAEPVDAAHSLFAGPGELRALCRALDWSRTPLGPVAAWPASLRTIARVVLAAPTGMVVLWGPDHVMLYNDAYREVMGAKHPWGLGRTNRELWPEVWSFNEPIFRGVLERGETFTFTDVRLVLDRPGLPSEAYFTLAFSPVPDDAGGTGGVLATVFETTTQVRVRSAQEEALREGEARLRLALDLAGLGTWQLDLADGSGDLDARGAEIVGLPSGPLENVAAAQLSAIHPDDLARIQAEMTAGIARGGDFDLDYRVRRPDGTVRDVSSRARAIPGPDGHPARLVGINRDVTTTREAEARLRASEAKYRALFESIDEGFCVIEVLFDAAGRAHDYRFLEANPAFVAQTGLTDPVGRTMRALAPTLEAHWFEIYGRIATTGQAERFEAPAAALGRWYDVSAFRVGDPAERRVAVLFNDVTGRKRAEGERERLLAGEHAARERAERLQSLTAALAGARTLDDVATVVVAEMVDALGARTGAMAVRDAAADDLVLVRHVGFPEAATARVGRQPVASTGPVPECYRTAAPVWVERRDGADGFDRRFPALVPVWDALGVAAGAYVPLEVAGEVVGVISFGFRAARPFEPAERAFLLALGRQAALAVERARLFDAERLARRDAEAANRAKSEFLAVMSHELRTPLNAIGGYAELIEMGIRGPITEEQREDLRRIQQSQRHLLGLINQVLNYTRVDAGAVRYSLEAVPAADALAAAEALVVPQVRARGLSYATTPVPPALAVRADREKLQQVLLNLLTNATKFTEPGGAIRVACAAEGGVVRFTVQDTGVGIAGDKLAHIFEPFVQVDQRLTRPHEGVGLGLAISRDLARGMGGDLTVASEPGAGSTFTLTLPKA